MELLTLEAGDFFIFTRWLRSRGGYCTCGTSSKPRHSRIELACIANIHYITPYLSHTTQEMKRKERKQSNSISSTSALIPSFQRCMPRGLQSIRRRRG